MRSLGFWWSVLGNKVLVLHYICACFSDFGRIDSMHLLSNFERYPPGFPLVGGDWGGSPPTTQPPPLPRKLACLPHDPSPPNCFDPKLPILSSSCGFWPFCPNCPPHYHQSNPFEKPCPPHNKNNSLSINTLSAHSSS